MLEIYEISREIRYNFEDIPFSEGYDYCPIEAFS